MRRIARTLPWGLPVALGLLGLAQLAHAQTAATIARGREIAERACSGCHAIDGPKDSVFQGTDVPSFRAIAARPNRTAARLETFVMVPHRPMPAIPLELSEVRDVVAYILSLK
jgi:mono/diheme cytochrome c family protein